MKSYLLAFISCAMMLASCSNTVDTAADVAYRNGRIYTVNETQPWVDAVAIKDGEFIAVGSAEDVKLFIGENTTVIDLDGKFMMPGIVDMHAHPFTGVDLGTGAANLSQPDNIDAILADVKSYIEAHPNADVVLGGNWNVGGLFKNDSPDKKLLDEIAPDTPVFLLSQSGHSGWANSKALELAGIDENFQNEGAYIFDRYPGSQEPSGTVRESGMVLIMNALHYLDPEVFAPFLKTEIVRYSRYGITAIQPAEGSPSWLKGAALLEDNNELNVRLFPALDWLTSQLRVLNEEETVAFINDWKTYETDQIHPHYVKIFADGAADSHTLLLKEAYSDAPGNHGSMYLPVEEYRKAIIDFYSRDISVHVHALGNGTAEKVVEIFEEAVRLYPNSKATLHFGHSQHIDSIELSRLAKLRSATMNFSPMLAVPHPQMDFFLRKPLGEERYQQIFPVQSAIEMGNTVGFGSDFPSSLIPDPDAFFYMEGWVTRMLPGSSSTETVNQREAVSVETAIRGFTLGGAEALGANYSSEFGSIEVGKSADMIILDQDLTTIPVRTIHKTRVLSTVFRGREVYAPQGVQ